MKKILYLFVFAVLLAACNSNPNESRRYTNGVFTELECKTLLQADTINSHEIYNTLDVLVDNDTVWLYSDVFTFDYQGEKKIQLTFSVSSIYPVDEDYIPVYPSESSRDYYAVLDFGKFRDINTYKSINLYCYYFNPSYKQMKYIFYYRYKLDKDQFIKKQKPFWQKISIQ